MTKKIRLFDKGALTAEENDLLCMLVEEKHDGPGAGADFYSGLNAIRSSVTTRKQKGRRRRKLFSLLALFVVLGFLFILATADRKAPQRVMLEGVSFMEASEIFHRQFGVSMIANTRELFDCRFTAFFEARDGDEAVATFCTLFGVQFEKGADSFHYIRGNCASSRSSRESSEFTIR